MEEQIKLPKQKKIVQPYYVTINKKKPFLKPSDAVVNLAELRKLVQRGEIECDINDDAKL